MGSAVHDWSLLIWEETGASTAIGCLIISLISPKIGWKVSTCVISESDHPYNSNHQKFLCSINACHWTRFIRIHTKIVAASDMESDLEASDIWNLHDYTMCCSWVLNGWKQYLYNRSPEREWNLLTYCKYFTSIVDILLHQISWYYCNEELLIPLAHPLSQSRRKVWEARVWFPILHLFMGAYTRLSLQFVVSQCIYNIVWIQGHN